MSLLSASGCFFALGLWDVGSSVGVGGFGIVVWVGVGGGVDRTGGASSK